MKHGEGKEEARELYVHQQMTFEEIAQRIGRTEKTIRAWAANENWKQSRTEVMRTWNKTREKLQLLIDRLADRMVRDSETEAELSPQSIHALTNLVSATKNLYTYESKARADETTSSNNELQLTPEQIAERVREIMGA